MTNAFTETRPSQIKFKQQSPKQRKDAATRVNRNEPLCAKFDAEKTQRIMKASI